MKNKKSLQFVNKARLAVLVGKSLTTIDSWIRRGMPYEKKGDKSCEWQFKTSDVLDWREEYIRDLHLKNKGTNELKEIKKRKLVSQVALLEMKLQKKCSEISTQERLDMAYEGYSPPVFHQKK